MDIDGEKQKTEAEGTWSSTWRSVVVGLREVIRPGCGWVVGDGRNVNFWTDKWLGGATLFDTAVEEGPGDMRHLKASDLWLEGFGWDMSRIAPFVSAETRLELAAVVVDRVSGREIVYHGQRRLMVGSRSPQHTGSCAGIVLSSQIWVSFSNKCGVSWRLREYGSSFG
ncbi:unnamed protein product [Microthlaspi erraticum]|uniref:Reverse transcriptase zinc-binding domain-containing protein n=1 Tax=Microthlaspi erraticum TaxID=1685480 RepID=A0A6D2L051_9BRAS|nr:unnamed protein product [Microthlaspi erraticum]